MPVYEYTCSDCSRRFELFVQQRAMADSVVCQHCSSTEVRRLVSTFASVGAGGEPYSAGDYGSESGGCSGGSCGCSTCG
jgi:putative FmdB family regulatory protein